MFVGRERELQKLSELWDEGGFQMVVVYGRRRVGKTTLIQEFARDKRALYYTALEQSDKDNLADFSRAVMAFFGLPASLPTFASWHDAFDYLAQRAAEERFVFIFDELPYAAKRNGSIPSLLQIAIDHSLKNTQTFMILCGSNQGYMESDVLGRKSPLYGRRTAQMRIEQLGFRDAAKMLPGTSAQEAFAYYGCFGGVPYYLSQVKPHRGLRGNLAELYFDTMGFLYDEPMGLLRQELEEPAFYNSILRAVARGANRQKEIADTVGVEQTTLSRYLKVLVNMGILERAVPFGENRETSKKGIYRICDACYDFWFRFVMPNVAAVESGLGSVVVDALPESQVDDYLGHRFERLSVEWLYLKATQRALPFAVTEVGSWWGTDPAARAQTDIDVVGANPYDHTALIGECKYRGQFDETAEIAKLEAKRHLLKGYDVRHLAVFSKHPLSPATVQKAVGRDDLLLVTLEGMYLD